MDGIWQQCLDNHIGIILVGTIPVICVSPECREQHVPTLAMEHIIVQIMREPKGCLTRKRMGRRFATVYESQLVRAGQAIVEKTLVRVDGDSASLKPDISRSRSGVVQLKFLPKDIQANI